MNEINKSGWQIGSLTNITIPVDTTVLRANCCNLKDLAGIKLLILRNYILDGITL
jgi:hypothetical protein